MSKAYELGKRQTLAAYEGALVAPWDEIAISYVLVVYNVAKKRPEEAFKEHLKLVSCAASYSALVEAVKLKFRIYRNFYQYIQNNTGWTLPALFAVLRDLRDIAYDVSCFKYQWKFDSVTRLHWQADLVSGKTECMEESARTITKAFSLCVVDRYAPHHI